MASPKPSPQVQRMRQRQTLSGLTRNWYSAWLPNSDAANRKPVFSTQTEVQGGMVSKYLTRSSVTASPEYSSVTLYRSPYSLCDYTPAHPLIMV